MTCLQENNNFAPKRNLHLSLAKPAEAGTKEAGQPYRDSPFSDRRGHCSRRMLGSRLPLVLRRRLSERRSSRVDFDLLVEDEEVAPQGSARSATRARCRAITARCSARFSTSPELPGSLSARSSPELPSDRPLEHLASSAGMLIDRFSIGRKGRRTGGSAGDRSDGEGRRASSCAGDRSEASSECRLCSSASAGGRKLSSPAAFSSARSCMILKLLDLHDNQIR
mmetsp:Transcript_103343/g.280780  ORF Transcript_103343/g.280780 Transcript_103343/m.280780 type:complete len:224 (-) Transcript_103343:303-974(-)